MKVDKDYIVIIANFISPVKAASCVNYLHIFC